MKIARTKNARNNIIFGSILKAFEIIVPFLMRTAIIQILGVQYLGLNGLFTSILQVLNLAELGVGHAMVFSMYKPIAEDDHNTICALMNLYRKYYRIIGLVVLCLGLCITPFLTKLVKIDTVPHDVDIYILYFLNLGSTVISYWLFAYKNCLLVAFQRTDVSNRISIVIGFLRHLFQYVSLLLFHSIYIYTFITLLFGIVGNITTAIIVDKKFPGYKPMGKLPESEVKKITQRIKDLFTSKVGTVVYNSVDSIVVSAFLGMTVLAIYQNYFFIISSITGFVAVIYHSVSAGIGNSLVVESKEKNLNDLTKFTFIICWISGFCSACLLCLFQPFMELWVGSKLLLAFPAVICYVIYFYIRQVNSVLNIYKDASGMWHEDRFRPLCAAMANLIMNLILVQFWGIYGVLLSTVFAILIVGIPWLLRNLFTVVFERFQMIRYLKNLVLYVFVSCVVCLITYFICSLIHLPLLLTIIVRLVICIILTNVLLYFAFRKKQEFHQSLMLFDSMTKGKLNKLLRHL